MHSTIHWRLYEVSRWGLGHSFWSLYGHFQIVSPENSLKKATFLSYSYLRGSPCILSKYHTALNEGFITVNEAFIKVNEGFTKVNEGFIKVNEGFMTVNEGFYHGQ